MKKTKSHALDECKGRVQHAHVAVSEEDSFIRQIPITERFKLHLSLQGFNIFNTPSFANPQRNEGASLASSNFGVSTRSRATGFGGGGLGSVYQTGGPRSIQIALRLQF